MAIWDVRVLHPQSFLIEIFRQEQAMVLTKLDQQATGRGRSLSELLDIPNATAPGRRTGRPLPFDGLLQNFAGAAGVRASGKTVARN